MKQCHETSAADNDRIELGMLLTALGHELTHAAESCGVLQWSISSLLDKVDHPDLAAEIHMLQDIDRLQQTLADIARILEAGATPAHAVDVQRDTVGAAIRLESLRHRLGLAQVNEPNPSNETDPDLDSDVMWF